jgi:MFS family permease
MPERPGRLLDRRLAAVLVAEAVSMTGAQMRWLALPWFVLVTSGSAARMSLVMAASALGVAVLGIPGGSVLERVGARRTMLLSDGLRVPLVLAIPLLHWAGGLSLAVLLALSFVLGALAAPYFAAQRVLLPSLVGEDEARVSRANALLQAATRGTMLAGPALGGVLIALLGAVEVLALTALAHGVGFAVLALLLRVEAAPRDATAGGVVAGLRYLAGDRLLRSWTASIALGDAAFTAIFLALPVLVFVSFDANPRVAGWLIASFGVGALAGNALAYRAVGRWQGLALVAAVIVFQALPLWVLVLPVSAVAVGAALAAAGLANGIVNPSLHSIVTLRPPPALRPHVLTAMITVNMLGAPVALLVAGPALDAFGTRPVLAAAVGLQTVAAAAIAVGALRGRSSPVGVPSAPPSPAS